MTSLANTPLAKASPCGLPPLPANVDIAKKGCSPLPLNTKIETMVARANVREAFSFQTGSSIFHSSRSAPKPAMLPSLETIRWLTA